jgi:hypothetical protein
LTEMSMNLCLAHPITHSIATRTADWRTLVRFATLALTTSMACIASAEAAVLVGWDVHSLTGGTGNFGSSPLSPTTTAANLTVGGLTRGSGVLTPSGTTAAARGWGGTDWVATSSAAAITAADVVTFTVAASAGYKVSISSISHFDYRRSSSGPSSGVLQYQVGGGAFVDAATLGYTSTASSGASLSAIDLSGMAALQNVAAGTPITFRVVNYGASGTGGTWYVFDALNTTASDLEVSGTVSAAGPSVNGSCGSSNGLTFPKPPTANLCADGSTPAVTDGGNAWSWSCPGSNGGQAAACTAVNSSASGC